MWEVCPDRISSGVGTWNSRLGDSPAMENRRHYLLGVFRRFRERTSVAVRHLCAGLATIGLFARALQSRLFTLVGVGVRSTRLPTERAPARRSLGTSP